MADRIVRTRLEVIASSAISALRQVSQGYNETGKAADNAAKSMDSASKPRKIDTGAKGAGAELGAAGKAAEAAGQKLGVYVDKAGRLRMANGQFANSATIAAAKAGELGEAARKAAEGLGSTEKSASGASGKLSDLGKAAFESAGGLDKAKASAQDVTDAWNSLGTKAGLAGAGMAAGLGLVVKSYADFDAAMSNVQASTHASQGDMSKLRDLAVEMGADTAYSAKEAAQGIDELAKAGVSTKDIMGGGLKGALALAAAGQMEVADASELAASTMTQFGLAGTDVEHVADLLAAGAGKAQGSVKDMGMALNQVGLVANATGVSVEETTGVLAAFASAGLTGSDAGTSFKTMLQRLTPQSKEAAETMDALGLSAYDSQGKFIGLQAYAGKLQTALSGMSAEQRNATMNTLFGADAVRAANVLYQQGAQGVADWTEKVNDAGYAAETAALKQDNLAGDLEKLKGSIDSVFLKSGTGANDFLRGLAQGAETLVDAIGKIPGPILGVGVGIAALGAAGLIGMSAFVKFRVAAAETMAQLTLLSAGGSKAATGILAAGSAAQVAGSKIGDLGAKAGLTQGKMSGLAKGMGGVLAVGGLLSMMDTSWMESLDQDGEAAARGMDNLKKSLNEGKASGEDLQLVFKGIVNEGEGLQAALDGIDGKGFGNMFDSIVTGAGKFLGLDVKTDVEQVKARFEDLDKTISGTTFDKAITQFQALAKQTDGSKESISKMIDAMPSFRGQLEQAASAAGLATDKNTLMGIAMGDIDAKAKSAQSGLDGAAGAMGEMGGKAEEASASIEDIVKGMQSLGLIKIDADIAVGEFAQTVRDAAKAATELGGQATILNGRFDATTESGMKAAQSLRGIQTDGFAAAQAMAESGASASQVSGHLTGMYNNLVTSGQAFGMTKSQAEAYARELMGIPKDVSVKTAMDDKAKLIAEGTKTAVENIPGQKDVKVNVSDGGTAAATAQGIQGVANQPYKAVIGATADTGAAETAITGVTRPRTQTTTVNPLVDAAEGKFNFAARERTQTTETNPLTAAAEDRFDFAARERIQTTETSPLTGSAEAAFNDAARMREQLTTAVPETGTAEDALEYAARARTQSTTADADTYTADQAIDYAARPRTAVITVESRDIGGGSFWTGGMPADRGLASGGMAQDVPGLASGGRARGLLPGIPPSDKRADNLRAVTEHGSPILLRSREFVVNEPNTAKNLGLLRWINAGRPAMEYLARGLATGGQYQAAPRAPQVVIRQDNTATATTGGQSSGQLVALKVNVDGRSAFDLMGRIQNEYGQ